VVCTGAKFGCVVALRERGPPWGSTITAVTDRMHLSLEEVASTLPAPLGFRPPMMTSVRESLSVLTVGTQLLRWPRAEAFVDKDMIPVVLVPGFLSGDFAFRPMAGALRARGHWTGKSGVAPDAGCTWDMVDLLEKNIEAAAECTGSRVAILGWSRGGTLGKLVTLRRPELVEALITLATPNLNPLAVNQSLTRQLRALSWLHARGVPGLMGKDCLQGACAGRVRDALEQDPPSRISYTSYFSMDDGVIDWRACLDPAADHVEVSATHMSIGADPLVMESVAGLLGALQPNPLT
jgi:triacylglycerol lipase